MSGLNLIFTVFKVYGEYSLDYICSGFNVIGLYSCFCEPSITLYDT